MSYFEQIKLLISQYDNQESMDTAIDEWKIDFDSDDNFISELCERYEELDMDNVPFALESLYKSTEKIKTMLFCILIELTCGDLPFITNLEKIPIFKAKLEFMYHSFAQVFKETFNGITDCIAMIILNCDSDLSLAKEEEKQIFIDSLAEKLNLIYNHIKMHGCVEDDVISGLAILLDLSTYINNDDILDTIKNIAKLDVDPECKLFLMKTEAVNELSEMTQLLNELIQYDASRVLRILDTIEKTSILSNIDISQEQIAYSEMKNWLQYPTELGESLDKLQYVSRFEYSGYEYYVYKFTASSEALVDKGYMLGVAGGYEKNSLSLDQTGHIFSKFEVIGSDPVQQALDIIHMMEDYWKQQMK